MPTEIRTFTAAEAAEILKVTAFEVTKLCRDERIRAHKPGKFWLIFEADLFDYIENGPANEQVPA